MAVKGTLLLSDLMVTVPPSTGAPVSSFTSPLTVVFSTTEMSLVGVAVALGVVVGLTLGEALVLGGVLGVPVGSALAVALALGVAVGGALGDSVALGLARGLLLGSEVGLALG